MARDRGPSSELGCFVTGFADPGDVSIPKGTRLSDAEIVGLGEATHGTKEFFEMKARLIRELIDHRGFRTVAFEAGASAMWGVDRVIRKDEGSLKDAVRGVDGWMYRTEAVYDLLRWIDAYNRDRPPGDRVRVRGIDLETPTTHARPVVAYLEEADPTYARRAEPVDVLRQTASSGEHADTEQSLRSVGTAARSVVDRLDTHREGYVSATSTAEWHEARYLCRVLERACSWGRVRREHEGPHPAGMRERDRAMAMSARQCLRSDPGEGVVVWAHNGHVQRGTFDDGRGWSDVRTMGDRLATATGGRYRAVGFDFGRGRFRAIDGGAAGSTRDTFTVGAPAADSLTAALDDIGNAPLALDLRRAADDERVDTWLAEPRGIRSVGSAFDPRAAETEYYQRTRLPEAFDLLFYVAESTPTVPLASE